MATGRCGGGSGTAGGPAAGAATAKVNLNTVTIADLDMLPRIGETMAQRILGLNALVGLCRAACVAVPRLR